MKNFTFRSLDEDRPIAGQVDELSEMFEIFSAKQTFPRGVRISCNHCNATIETGPAAARDPSAEGKIDKEWREAHAHIT